MSMTERDTLGYIIKDVDEYRTFEMRWTDHLGTDTIATSDWTVPAGLTLITKSIGNSNRSAYVKLSGGVDGTDYIITNTITTTTSAETLSFSGTVRVRSR